MRSRYIVAYDVAEARRLRRVHRVLRGFGDAVQYSVFRCDLSASERVLLVEALTGVMHMKQDSVLIVDIGPASGRGRECVEVLGLRKEAAERIAVVV